MTAASFRRLIVICAALGIAAPVLAQQASSTAPAAPTSSTPAAATPSPPAAAPTKAPTAPDVPNPDVLKKARNAGFHTKVSHNVVLYCRTDTDTGTRFATEKCLNEDQLLQHLAFTQAQRDQLMGHSCAGSGCSGK